ncbi:hypothetical protein [Streptomyces sp. NBC_00878]|uniref:hypothetical protein n=1 Tax=Streptomyces sp. NBC_00878 TaxID=2975854 RepID=UPI00224E9CBE|nr:hypothetical protein [Streptomyces sp. NBC_00878]MCX4906832.1 hypothetical protein [Streptomyces sp. NBC_00878]
MRSVAGAAGPSLSMCRIVTPAVRDEAGQTMIVRLLVAQASTVAARMCTER